MTKTAMAEAFHRAGIKSAEERLTEIAIRAMIKHADNTFATVETIWQEVQKDRDLLLALFAHGWRREVSALMYRTRTLIATKESRGEPMAPVERKAAKVVALINEQDRRYEQEQREEERAAQAEADRQHQERLEAWRRTQIGSLSISDKPVWQCSAATVRAWLQTQRQRWRTVELLIEGLPDDGRPIEYYRTPDEVAALWRAAGER